MQGKYSLSNPYQEYCFFFLIIEMKMPHDKMKQGIMKIDGR